MKYIIILMIGMSMNGCTRFVNESGETVTKNGPFTTLEKYPDQEKNIREAPRLPDCEWIIPGTPSAKGCEKVEVKEEE